MKYDFKTVEAKWQKVWQDEHTFHAEIDHSKPKFYALVEFPYPSAAGLHVGHPRSYTALDIVARKKRQCGYNVLYPMGWDAFGLPTENYALKNHINPEIVTAKNVARFKSQLQALGLSFDWDREINTTDPEYYKWTQWIFLQLYKKGPCLQEGDHRQLLHRLQGGAGQRGSGQRRLRAVRQPGGAARQEPVDAQDHGLRRPPHRRPGRCGLHRAGQDPAAQLDRPQPRRRDQLRHHRRRYADGLHHPRRHAVRLHLHGGQPRACLHQEVGGRRPHQEHRGRRCLPGGGRPQV